LELLLPLPPLELLLPLPPLELLLPLELESLEGEESELESLEEEESELESLLEGPEGDDLPLRLDFPEGEYPFFPPL